VRTLVDSNVILDVVTDSPWADWSRQRLTDCAQNGRLVINPLIFAEVSIGFDTVEHVEALLDHDYFEYADLPWAAAFLAGKCFAEYRRRGGERRSPLPDFYIGAHAAVSGMVLLTRDARRYRTYFPKLDVRAPEA
jgi:predicted nucleic acid-binding protein